MDNGNAEKYFYHPIVELNHKGGTNNEISCLCTQCGNVRLQAIKIPELPKRFCSKTADVYELR